MARHKFNRIPQAMRVLPNWWTWNTENGKRAIYNPAAGAACDPHDYRQLCSFTAAVNAYQIGKYEGIGFTIFERNNLTRVLINKNIDGSGEVLEDFLQGIGGCSYIEQVPEGTALATDDVVLAERQTEKGPVLRVAGVKMPQGGVKVAPSLEDAFLYIFRDETEKE